MAAEMGGPDKIERQHAAGRLTIRERIDALVDPGTFREIGALSGKGTYDALGQLVSFTPANRLTGRAQIDGRPVVISGDDFTVCPPVPLSWLSASAQYAERTTRIRRRSTRWPGATRRLRHHSP